MRAQRIDGDPVERFWAKVDKRGHGECWLWTAGTAQGYGVLGLWDGTKVTLARAHRFSYELHRGPIPSGLWVLHHCDVRACVNPDHLFVGTAKDNTQDMMRKGRRHINRLSGEGNPSVKLTFAQVREIRERWDSGERQIDLRREFGMSRSQIYAICHRLSWREL